MKHWVFIQTLFWGILLFSLQDVVKSNNIDVPCEETVMIETDTADIQHFLSVLSADLQDCKGLTARRSIQATNSTHLLQAQKKGEKTVQSIRLKETNTLRKVSENLSEYQTIHLSTLFCRMAQHLFVLRKLII